MTGMRVDHVVYAAERDGLKATAQRLAEQIGVTPVDGGVHPRFGTRNIILPLAHERYVEVVEVLDHPASDKAPFGQAVRARSEAGGGWLGWVVQVDDISQVETRLGREAVVGNRHRPDGVELRWRQVGVKGLQSDPQLPFFVQWESPAAQPPSAGGSDETRYSTVSPRRRGTRSQPTRTTPTCWSASPSEPRRSRASSHGSTSARTTWAPASAGRRPRRSPGSAPRTCGLAAGRTRWKPATARRW